MNLIVPHGFEANYTVGFVRGLTSLGVDCLVVSDDEIAPRLDAAGIPNLNLRGSTTTRRSSARKFANLARYYAGLLLLAARNRGATIHFTGIFRNEAIVIEGGLLHLALRLVAGRYVYTAHNVLPHSRRHSRFFRLAYRWIYRVPSVIVAHNQAAADELVRDFGVARERLRVIPIGLNEEMPDTALTRADARRRLRLADSERAILFFGKVERYKGLERLIAAFAMLPPDTRLIVAGEFRDPALRAELQAQFTASPRRADIQVFDRSIPNEEVEVLFKGCDVLCLPYHQVYQSGLAYLAPRFGLPIVATPVGALPELLAEGFGCVAPTNDVAGITTALQTFLAAPARFRRDDLVARAQRLRWERVCAPLLSCYHTQHRPPVPPAAPSRHALGELPTPP